MAIRLEKAGWSNADHWLRLQTAYALAQLTDLVEEERAPPRGFRCARCTAVEHTPCRFLAREDQRKTISMRQVDNGAVCCQSLVRGQQDELLELRLRD